MIRFKDILLTITIIVMAYTPLSAGEPQWMVFDTTNSSIPFNSITDIVIDINNVGWLINNINNNGEIVKFDMSDFNIYNSTDFERLKYGVSSINIDYNNNLWVGLHWEYRSVDGIIKFDGNNWNLYDPNYISESTRIYTILCDLDDNIWIGRWALNNVRGLDKYNTINNSWTKFTTNDSPIPENDILSLNLDLANNLWIGTDGGGVARFDRVSSWEIYNMSNSGLPNNRIDCIGMDKQNNKWFGTYDGLAKLDSSGNWSVYTPSTHNMPSKYVTSIVQDRDGDLWFGTRKGLLKLDSEDFLLYDTANSELPINLIYDIALDSSNNLWIGTPYGLAVFNEDGISIEVGNLNSVKYMPSNVYPNPISPGTKLKVNLPILPGKAKRTEIRLFNIRGEMVRKINISENTTRSKISFNFNELSNGVYILKANIGSKQYTKKLIFVR